MTETKISETKLNELMASYHKTFNNNVCVFAINHCRFLIIDLNDNQFKLSGKVFKQGVLNYRDYAEIQDNIFVDCDNEETQALNNFYQTWQAKQGNLTDFTETELTDLLNAIDSLSFYYPYDTGTHVDSMLALGAESFPEEAIINYRRQFDMLESTNPGRSEIAEYLANADKKLPHFYSSEDIDDMIKDKSATDVQIMLKGYDSNLEWHYLNTDGNVDDEQFEEELENIFYDAKDLLADLIDEAVESMAQKG